MNNAARQREVLDPSPSRTRRSRLDIDSPLAIPANSITTVTRNTDVRMVQNWLNRLPDGCNSPQSPDELVIQKRGRRKSIVWSPDLDTYKRRSLLSLSSRDCTPVKNFTTPDMTLRDAARKRLSLTDTHQSEFSTPKNRKISSSSGMSLDAINTSREQSNDNLVNSLRGLSREQLIHLIMELVYAQEDGTLRENEKFRNVLLNKMPAADIQPLIDKLKILKQNVYTSLVFSSNMDDNSTYSRAYMHMDAFQKAVVDQGRILQESHHWASLMRYILKVWEIARELPEWKCEGSYNITRKCFKDLSQFCIEAIKRGNFEASVLEDYIESLEIIVGKCEDFQICLQTAKEAKASRNKLGLGLLF